MDKIYLLEHSYNRDGFEYKKFLGLYSSLKYIDESIDKYKKMEGFCDWPNSFCITELELKGNLNMKEIIRKVFLLEHAYEKDGDDIVEYISVFSQNDIAESAMQEYVKNMDLGECSEEVYINEYELDKMEWTEGFVTIMYN